MGLLDSLIGSLGQAQGGGMGAGQGAGMGAPGGGGLGDLLGAALGGQAGGGGGQGQLLAIVLGMLANRGGPSGAGGLGGALGGALGSALGPAMGGGGGGLGGLMAQFQQAGLGDVMNSWISAGENRAVSPDQLGQVFGDEGLSSIANQLGVSKIDAASQLSELLPQVVDRLTPTGEAPAGGLGSIEDLMAMLTKR